MKLEIDRDFDIWYTNTVARLREDGIIVEGESEVVEYSPKSPHQDRVEAFMRAGGHRVPDRPEVPTPEVCLLRARLALEETLETIAALGFEVVPHGDADHVHMAGLDFRRVGQPDLVKVVDGCCDTRVIATGTLSAFGVADESVQREVDRSNMDKFKDGVQHDQYGKIKKPAGWRPPDLDGVLKAQGWKDGRP